VAAPPVDYVVQHSAWPRIALSALCAGGVLLAAPQASAQAFTQVTVNLGSSSFDRTLPFDEEFKIVGAAPFAVRLMQVFYSQRSANPPECPFVGLVSRMAGMVRTNSEHCRRNRFRSAHRESARGRA